MSPGCLPRPGSHRKTSLFSLYSSEPCFLLHFLHAFVSQVHVLSRRLLRFFDEAMKQHHTPTDKAENYPACLSVCQVASHFPKPVAKAAAIRHPDRPAKLDLLHIPTDKLAVFGRASLDPVPDGLVATRRFVEECRQLLGAVDQRILCQN